jgi:hypothetical protein
MEWKKDVRILAWVAGFFLFAYFMPVGTERFNNALLEAFKLTKWYAREHVLLCLIPAFFIAGVIAVFVSQGAVMKYFGAKAAKWKAYLVASLSGTILAVCSCTILPLFSSIHKRGAGTGFASGRASIIAPEYVGYQERNRNSKNCCLCDSSINYGNNQRVDLWFNCLTQSPVRSPQLSEAKSASGGSPVS